MKVFTRYLLYQLPGWVFLLSVLILVARWWHWPGWLISVLFLAYVVKDFILYPFLKRAYEGAEPAGSERLIGELGVSVEPLSHGREGYVRVLGELWRARLHGARQIEAGQKVRVRASSGMLLEVEPVATDTRVLSPAADDGVARQ